MLPRTVGYIMHTHLAKGRSPETIVERWNRGYPDHPLTVAEVRKVIAEAKPKKAKPKAKKR